MKKLVGFTGKMKVGKTTSANVLSELENFRVLAFAEPVKQALAIATGLPLVYFKDKDLKDTQIEGLPEGITPRYMMQEFATGFIRNKVFSEFWIWRMQGVLDRTSGENIVIDDIRFENEAELVRQHGGRVVHLIRDNVIYTEGEREALLHNSESGIKISPGDIVITNAVSEQESASEVLKQL